MDITRTNLALIARVLADLDAGLSMCRAADRYNVHRTTILRWTQVRARHDGHWPTEQLITEQRRRLTESVERRRRVQRRTILGEYRLVPALGAQRRIQALLAMGYRLRDLGDHMGVSTARVHQLAHQQNKTLIRDTDTKVRACYTALHTVPPRPASEPWLVRQRRVAARNGWAPPLAWETDAAMDDPAARPNLRWIRSAA